MTDKKLDQTISDWLEAERPGQLPDRVLRATFERTRNTRQRVGWRVLPWKFSMPRFAPALASAAIVLVVVVVAVGIYFDGQRGIGRNPTASPPRGPTTSPSPSSTPEPARGSFTFTSTIHDVSIEYPSTWEVRPATETWDRGAFTFDAPGVDVIFDPIHQDNLYLSIASAPLDGQSAEDWCCSELWAAVEVCESGGNFGRFTLDGAEANIRGCDGAANQFEDHVVQAATNTHGYVIYLHVAPDQNLQEIYTEDWFDAVLETIDLP